MRILAVLFSLLLALPASAATVNLVRDGTVDRVDPNAIGEDVFYSLGPIDLDPVNNQSGALVTFGLNDPLGLGGTLDLLISSIVGASNWNFTAYTVTVDGATTAQSFGVDILSTPDFNVPIDFSLGMAAVVSLFNFDSSGAEPRNPVGYSGSEQMLQLAFGSDLFTGTGTGTGTGGSGGGGGLVGAEVPLPAGFWLGLTGLGMLFGYGRYGRARRSTA